MKVHILEPDDGSGWVKVADMTGDSGLVPATYLKTIDPEPSEGSTRSGARRRGKWYKGVTLAFTDIPYLRHSKFGRYTRIRGRTRTN